MRPSYIQTVLLEEEGLEREGLRDLTGTYYQHCGYDKNWQEGTLSCFLPSIGI
jgi:hypothetical protein